MFTIRCVIVLLLATSFMACGIIQKQSMTKYALPQLEVPEKTKLLYEYIVVNDLDRTGNWRFFFRQDGCFFNARNTQLWIEESEQLSSDAPELYWNTPFPDTPNRCLTKAQQSELTKAIYRANFSKLTEHYPTLIDEQVSHSSVERWTVIQDSRYYTVIVENGFSPSTLMKLRQEIDIFVTNAPRSQVGWAMPTTT